MGDELIEMIDKIDIKNDADLNMQVNKIAETINAINKAAVKIGDFELIQKDNAELKAALEVNSTELAALKAIKNDRFATKSEEEKLYNIGKFILAMRTKNMAVIKEMGGAIQANPRKVSEENIVALYEQCY